MVQHREGSAHTCGKCEFFGRRCKGCLVYGVHVGAQSRACRPWFRFAVEPEPRLFEVESLTVEAVSR